MNKKFLLFSSLVLLSCASMHVCDAAETSIEAYESKRIATIDVVIECLAPYSTSPKTILSKLKTKVGDPFSQITFDSDLKTLSDEYDRVEPTIEVRDREVYITLKVWPRPSIRTINWKGNSHFKTKTLQKELGIKPHAVFNRQTFNKAFTKVKEHYIKNGYFESQLHYSVNIDPKTNEVDIDITIQEGRSGIVNDIVFYGFSKDEQSEILEMIYTKKHIFLISWFTGIGKYNEEAIEQDKLTIVNYLQNKGYADAKVDIKIKDVPSKDKILIEIHAERGVVYHFGKVTFFGNHIFTDEEIEKHFLVRPDAVYSPDKMRSTVEAIKEMYGRKGYIDTIVHYEAKLVENEPLYNVHFEIEEGGQYKIGMIRIFGNVHTQSSVILHESLLVPGETFNSAKLNLTQKRLENIGYFKNVNVYAVRTQEDLALGENYRDVYIEVEEGMTGNLNLFFGLSSADSVFGGLDLIESNFNYKGFSKFFKQGPRALRGGGEYAHARVSIGAKQRTYSISWLNPYFRDTLWRLGFETSYSTSSLQSKDYDIDVLSLTLHTSYPLNYFWSFGWKYRVRDSRIHIAHHHTSKEEREQSKNSGILSGTAVSLVFDSTDNHRKPRNGFRSVLEAEYVGIFGDSYFLRFGYTNSYYAQLWRRGIMKYRWDFKFIQPLLSTNKAEEIPISERFFLGGESSVRGYKAFDIGPHYKHTGDPKGGISASCLSIEYLQEVLPILDLFVFADAGSVSMRRYTIHKYFMSYGFGARIEMIGKLPIILGMGFPVNAGTRHEVERFFFSMGGQF